MHIKARGKGWRQTQRSEGQWTRERWRSEALSQPTPPDSPRHAAPSYLMGTPDCLMFVTVVQRTPHPAVQIWSNRGPTATLSRQSASCHLRGKRSIQVTSRLTRVVPRDHLYAVTNKHGCSDTPPTFLAVCFRKLRLQMQLHLESGTF